VREREGSRRGFGARMARRGEVWRAEVDAAGDER
jgi:hypothetical protein